MGTLRKTKLHMKMDKNWRKMLVKGSKDEILIDLDGDKVADIAIMDCDNDGDIDTFAFDLTGDGEFNLYISDTDKNGVPDLILLDEEGNGENIEVLGMGTEVEESIKAAAVVLGRALEAADEIADQIEKDVDALYEEVKQARKAIKKAR